MVDGHVQNGTQACACYVEEAPTSTVTVTVTPTHARTHAYA